MSSEGEHTEAIKRLNDEFRCSVGVLPTGKNRVSYTQGIRALGEESVRNIFDKVRNFDNFPPENDPYGEHDFGSFDHDGQKIFWKIDCYDNSLMHGSAKPENPNETTRVMTVMLANEY